MDSKIAHHQPIFEFFSSLLEEADAASVMASADATGRTKREKLVKANPFLERFTVADLKTWADRKMRVHPT